MPESNPIVSGSAPRLSLVIHAGRPEERVVRCQRVVTLLGSREGCKILLKHRRVAPVHAAIVQTGGRVLAVDLVTRSGSRLNDLQLSCETLHDGDRLGIHKWEFVARIETPGRVPLDDDLVEAVHEHPGVVLQHVETGKTLKPQREVCILGRRQGCDIAVGDKRVSRVHALLLTYLGRPAVFDLLSLNGTFVNEEPVVFRLLEDGDELRLGASVFRVQVPAPAGAGDNGRSAAATDVLRSPEDTASDLVDIAAAEGTQRWRIAEKLEKGSRKSAPRA
ncbi:MAG: FHA domain-containing protein [Planctomycetota bacterium]|nr:MAG: FHA domain-containing protein [Planctomycetota bacterium]